MYETIQALYRKKDLDIAVNVKADKIYQIWVERKAQLQALMEKDCPPEQLHILQEYYELTDAMRNMENEAAYINGYLWGSRLTRDTLSTEK